jgi:hypothetical protein
MRSIAREAEMTTKFFMSIVLSGYSNPQPVLASVQDEKNACQKKLSRCFAAKEQRLSKTIFEMS